MVWCAAHRISGAPLGSIHAVMHAAIGCHPRCHAFALPSCRTTVHTANSLSLRMPLLRSAVTSVHTATTDADERAHRHYCSAVTSVPCASPARRPLLGSKLAALHERRRPQRVRIVPKRGQLCRGHGCPRWQQWPPASSRRWDRAALAGLRDWVEHQAARHGSASCAASRDAVVSHAFGGSGTICCVRVSKVCGRGTAVAGLACILTAGTIIAVADRAATVAGRAAIVAGQACSLTDPAGRRLSLRGAAPHLHQ